MGVFLSTGGSRHSSTSSPKYSLLGVSSSLKYSGSVKQSCWIIYSDIMFTRSVSHKKM